MDADRIINDYTSDKPESFGGAFRFNNTKDKDEFSSYRPLFNTTLLAKLL